MKISILHNPQALHQANHAKALKEGLAVHGIEADFVHSLQSVKNHNVACWGWRIGRALHMRGHNVLVMERGYLGDRFKFTSLAMNGLNGHAKFPDYPDDGGERWKSHNIELLPWKVSGIYALILGQVPTDASLKGMNLTPWYNMMAARIKQFYKIPVFFREHPEAIKRGLKFKNLLVPKITGSLASNLHQAKFSVCFNSNAAVDSVIAGVPCIIGDRGSMAWDVASTNLENLVYPDREKWAHSLAFKQWAMDEIKSGKALEKMICNFV